MERIPARPVAATGYRGPDPDPDAANIAGVSIAESREY
jgi:hypothetical protein